MALSNGNGLSSGPLIFLNPRSKDSKGNKITPHFEAAKVGEDGKIAPTGETATKVSGDLLRPRFTVRKFNDVDNKHVVLYIKDGEETYNLDLTYRISTRSLFNALLSVTDPKGVEISIYESKKGYEAISLWQNGEMVPWKFDSRPEAGQVPEAITVKFKGKDQHDYTPVDDFYEENLKAWADEVFGPEKAQNKVVSETKEEQQDEPAPTPVKNVAPKTTSKPVAPAKAASKVAQKVAPKVEPEEDPLDENSIPF